MGERKPIELELDGTEILRGTCAGGYVQKFEMNTESC